MQKIINRKVKGMIIALIKTSELDVDLLIVLAVALPVILLIMLVLLVVASPYFRKIQEKIDNLTVVLRENLTGIRVIRAYDQEQTETKKFTYNYIKCTFINISCYGGYI